MMKIQDFVTDSFIAHVKADDIYKDIAEDVKTRFDNSNFEIEIPLPKGKNKKLIGLMKDELGGQIMKDFFGLRAKTYNYLKDNNDEGTKKCAIKRKLKFQDYENCLEAAEIERKINYLRKKQIDVASLKEDQKYFVKNNKLILKTQQRFKSERHNRSIDSIETYAYGTSKDLICKKEKIKRNNIIKQYKNV